MLFWSILLGVPVLAFGGVALFSPSAAKSFSVFFRSSRLVAWPLTAIAWFWTAYECDIIGIDAFDAVTKIFPGQLWIMAVVLTYLTAAWMPEHLSVRALCGILMLVPAELFKSTHALRPEAGVAFAPIDIVVALVYLGAMIGMYGMFYPWRLEKAFDVVFSKDWGGRLFGAFMCAAGASFTVISLTAH